MRKVLIIIVLLLFNVLIYKGAWASSTLELNRTGFSCQNQNILQKIVSYFSHEPSYVLVLERSENYQQLLIKKSALERKLKSVDILDRYGFDLVIAQRGQEFLLINNFCYGHEDALSNKKTLRFFFNLPVELVSVGQDHKFGRTPASMTTDQPLYLVSFDKK